MREHLYRGFHPNKNGTTEITLNGEKIKGYWVKGNLFVSDDKTECQILMGNKTIRIPYDVLHETVCEYTGLTDKNGKRIFEDDIVKVITPHNAIGFVKIGIGEISVADYKVIGVYGEIKGERGEMAARAEGNYEVIGNIFEYTELLK